MGRVILYPPFADPTDIIIQGEQPIPLPALELWLPSIMLQRETPLSTLKGMPVPRHMIGQSELYGVPKRVGPMALFGGQVVMQDIGPSPPYNVLVNSTQAWLNSSVNMDLTGGLMDLTGDLLFTSQEPDYFVSRQLIGDIDVSMLRMPTVTPIPRPEINMSRPGNVLTASNPPFAKWYPLCETFVESCRRWLLTGVTKDSTGAVLGACRVLALKTDKIKCDASAYANPIEDDTVSDASGNYLMSVKTNEAYQVLAYKPGGTDVAGVTVNTLGPVQG